MRKIEYKSSILDEIPEDCPRTCIVRYGLDQNVDWWIEVVATDRGIEVRSEGGRMQVQPISGNVIEVFLGQRSS